MNCDIENNSGVMFGRAKPVWIQGFRNEKNMHAGFRAVFSVSGNLPVLLRLTGSSIYRVFLNGEFV